MYHHRYWLCALTVRWLFPLEFILLIWTLYGFTCSWVSPRWFVFASSCCLEMPPTQAVRGFSDYMGSMNSGHKPLWVLTCYQSSGGIFAFYFQSVESFTWVNHTAGLLPLHFDTEGRAHWKTSYMRSFLLDFSR